MGGQVNVAIRFPDGSAVCHTHWTNSMSAWLNHSKVFSGDSKYLKEFIGVSCRYGSDCGYGCKSELTRADYGLIVIDLKKMLFIDQNEYTRFGCMSLSKFRISNDLQDFYEMLDAGKIYLRTSGIGRNELRRTLLNRESLAEFTNNNFRVQDTQIENGCPLEFDFAFDTKPMQILCFNYSQRSTNMIMALLNQIGFPLNEKEGLNQ